MGNSRAYPVHRTTDAAEAYVQAKRLCALLERLDDEMYLSADLRTADEVRRMATVLPRGDYSPVAPLRDPVTDEYLFCTVETLPEDPAELAAVLPIHVTAYVPPSAAVEEAFLGALGEGPASMDWSGLWLLVPGLGDPGPDKYHGVQAVFHAEDADAEQWSETHTVFVHVYKGGDPDRARWLAAQIGSDVLGESQTGW
ncbi:hypothetical protein ABZ611_14640 [Streptomyces sp. NPDC007861]|uniref:hypothetical protein n=1 Tax=Streptomyces sp. NPDC007861 TaxID=3154893 RepID=UPI0033C41B01